MKDHRVALLVVTNDDDLSARICDILQNETARISTTRTADALQHASLDEFDALIVAGAENEIAYVRAETQRGCRPPILFVDPNADCRRDDAVLSAGAVGYHALDSDPDTALVRAVRYAARNFRTRNDDRWEIAFQSAAVGIAVVNAKGVIVEANDALAEMLGYTSDEFRALDAAVVIHPEDLDTDLDLFQQIHRGELDQYHIEKRYIRKNGETMWGRLAVSTSRDSDGKLLHIFGMVEDITEHKRAQEDLEYTISSANCLLWHGTADWNGRWYDWDLSPLNEQVAQRFLPLELRDGEEYQHAWYRSRHAEDRIRTDQRAIQALQSKETSYSQEFRCLDRSGQTLWMNEEVYIDYADGGDRAILVGVCTDITDRKQSDERLDRVLSTVRCLFWYGSVERGDDNGLYWDLYPVNEEAAQQLLPLDLLPGEAYLDAVHRNKTPVLRRRNAEQADTAVRRGDTHYSQEHAVADKFGEIRWFYEDVFIEPESQPGRWRLVGVATDITERKRAEEEVRRSQQRAELLNRISSGIHFGMGIDKIVDHVVLESAAVFPQYRVTYGAADQSGALTLMRSERPEHMSSIQGLVFDLSGAPDYLQRLRDHELAIINNTQTDPLIAPFADAMKSIGSFSVLDAPVHHHDGLIGVLCFDNSSTHEWEPHEIQTVRDVADYLSLAIGEAKSHQQRSEAQAALRESETQFRAMFENAPIGILISDADGDPIEGNDALLALLSYTPEELRRQDGHKLIDPRDMDAIYAQY
ncbi:MAG: PAS domain S-box protein, partial [Candidatus Poribacteria bacterium]|nr:PAS domain S-box protein [Candidatus Poribacteria bacterium]